MTIKAQDVKALREKTGLGMMECKKALQEADGNLDDAIKNLRKSSALKAEKKASRVAADGVLKAYVGDEYSTIVEINSETDFAAKDSKFIEFTNEVADFIASNKVEDITVLHESEIESKRKALVQAIGENIQVRRLETLTYSNDLNTGLYIHLSLIHI